MFSQGGSVALLENSKGKPILFFRFVLMGRIPRCDEPESNIFGVPFAAKTIDKMHQPLSTALS